MGTKYRGQLGITAPITVNSQTLAYASGPTLNFSYETEELDLTIAGIVKAYANGRIELGISFQMKRFKSVDGGALPADVAAILAAFQSGVGIPVAFSDSVIGDVSGDFIVTKCDEDRANGKIIGYSVEMKPTFEGTALSWTAYSGGGSEGSES